TDTQFGAATFEGQLHVGGPLSVNYAYDLPTNLLGTSSGSHRFTVVYEFGRVPEVVERDLPTPLVLESRYDDPQVDLKPHVWVAATERRLQVLEQSIVREVRPDVPEAALAGLTLADVGVLDSSITLEQRQIYRGNPIPSVPD